MIPTNQSTVSRLDQSECTILQEDHRCMQFTFAGGDLVGGEVVEYLVQRHVHPHTVLVGEVLGGCLRQQGVSGI